MCPDWSVIFVWAIGIIVMTGLTLRDFLPLFDDYQYNNLATVLTVAREENITKPNVTLCVPYYSASLMNITMCLFAYSDYIARISKEASEKSDWGQFPLITFDIQVFECMYSDILKNRSWDVWRDMQFNYTKETVLNFKPDRDELAAALVKKILKQGNIDFLHLDQSNFNWNQPLVDSVYILFCAYARMDLIFLLGSSSELPCKSFNLSEIGPIDRQTMDKMYQSVMDGIMIYLNHPNSADMKNSQIFFSDDAFCIPTQPDDFNRDFIQWTLIDDNQQLPPWDRRLGPRNPFFVLRDDTTLYAGVQKFGALYKTGPTKLQDPSSEKIYLSYSIGTKVIETRSQKICSRDGNPARCLLQRQYNAALDRCGCVPFSYRFFANNLSRPYCTPDLYHSCENSLQEMLEPNRNFCNDLCEYTTYEFNQYSETEERGQMQNMSFVVRLDQEPKLYIAFKLTEQTSPQMFMSQIGGIVNFYLGFDGLTLCVLITYLLKRCKQRYGAKTQHRDGTGAVVDAGAVRMNVVSDQYRVQVARAAMDAQMQTSIAVIFQKIKRIEDRLFAHKQ